MDVFIHSYVHICVEVQLTDHTNLYTFLKSSVHRMDLEIVSTQTDNRTCLFDPCARVQSSPPPLA